MIFKIITKKLYNPNYPELHYTQQHEHYYTCNEEKLKLMIRALERNDHELVSIAKVLSIPALVDYSVTQKVRYNPRSRFLDNVDVVRW